MTVDDETGIVSLEIDSLADPEGKDVCQATRGDAVPSETAAPEEAEDDDGLTVPCLVS